MDFVEQFPFPSSLYKLYATLSCLELFTDMKAASVFSIQSNRANSFWGVFPQIPNHCLSGFCRHCDFKL